MCQLRIIERALIAAGERGDARVERQLRRGTEFCRRSLRRVQIAQFGSSFERTVEQLRVQFDRYYNAILRRSPWFPRMKAIRIEEFEAESRSRQLELQAHGN
jgi:hypothetical protein